MADIGVSRDPEKYSVLGQVIASAIIAIVFAAVTILLYGGA